MIWIRKFLDRCEMYHNLDDLWIGKRDAWYSIPEDLFQWVYPTKYSSNKLKTLIFLLFIRMNNFYFRMFNLCYFTVQLKSSFWYGVGLNGNFIKSFFFLICKFFMNRIILKGWRVLKVSLKQFNNSDTVIVIWPLHNLFYKLKCNEIQFKILNIYGEVAKHIGLWRIIYKGLLYILYDINITFDQIIVFIIIFISFLFLAHVNVLLYIWNR